LEQQLSETIKNLKECTTRKKVEEQSFRKALKTEKQAFDNKLVIRTTKLDDRCKVVDNSFKHFKPLF